MSSQESYLKIARTHVAEKSITTSFPSPDARMSRASTSSHVDSSWTAPPRGIRLTVPNGLVEILDNLSTSLLDRRNDGEAATRLAVLNTKAEIMAKSGVFIFKNSQWVEGIYCTDSSSFNSAANQCSSDNLCFCVFVACGLLVWYARMYVDRSVIDETC